MRSFVHTPGPILRPYADHFFFNEGDRVDGRGTYFPALRGELFFHFGDTFQVRVGGAETGAPSWMSGLQAAPMQVAIAGRHLSCGVLLKPWALYAAFGIPAGQSAGRLLPLPPPFDEMEARLRRMTQGGAPGEILEAMEACLLRAFRPARVHGRVLEALMDEVPLPLHKGAVQEAAAQTGLRPKSYIEAFHRITGFTPGVYAQLQHVSAAVALLRNAPERSLTDIAYELGFYDQAHFIRCFRAFCGCTPGQFRRSRPDRFTGLAA